MGIAVCSCDSGYTGSPPTCVRPECMVSSECPQDKACVNQKCVDACEGVCGVNALCQVMKHTPVCSCVDGTEGDPFEKSLVCTSTNSNAVCSCLPGYVGSPPTCAECVVNSDCSLGKACINKKCADPCEGTCGTNAHCDVFNHSPVCSCGPGLTGNPFVICRQEASKPPPGNCILPPYPVNGDYTTGITDAEPGQGFLYVAVNVTCHPGYGVVGPSSTTCVNGMWPFPFPKCIPMCELKPNPTVEYRCLASVADEAYRPCGKCGKVTPDGAQLVVGGESAKKGELPWHVGIYKKSFMVLVPAAHCFWHNHEKLPASLFAVAVGKLYRPWNNEVDEAQKSDVEEIIMPPRFQGAANNYQDDIAGVIVAHPFKFETFVRPVCINFEINIDRIQVQDGTKGKVAGWGLTGENGNASSVLQVVELPYVEVSTCIKNVPAIFLEYITSDKICAGTLDTKTALCRGDSGGGLAFPIADRGTLRYYLHGVVSTAPNDEQDLQTTPCNPSPCGPNSVCTHCNKYYCSRTSFVCSCMSGYIGSPPTCVRPECMASSECPQDKACVNQKCVDACEGACGVNALCQVINHSPVCSCGDGTEGDPLVSCRKKANAISTTPCNPSPCGPNSVCTQCNNKYYCSSSFVCSCMSGYIGSPPTCVRPECMASSECPQDKACVNQKCVDACEGACGVNALCQVINHSPVCSCGDGTEGDPLVSCRKKANAVSTKPCDGSPCGPNSVCTHCNKYYCSRTSFVCSCMSGYIGSPPNCTECVVNSECSLGKACINKKCADPCEGTCGTNAHCDVFNHSPVCSCGPGLTGDPFVICRQEAINGDYTTGIPDAEPGQGFLYVAVNVTCHPGYGVVGPSSTTCVNGMWPFPFPKCVPMCELKPNPTVEYRCLASVANEAYRPCGSREPAGTIVNPICRQPNYYYAGNLYLMHCIDGRWNYIARCTPECGKLTPDGAQLVVGGESAKKGELPWHVGIYKKSFTPYMQVCGGSLITNKVVISGQVEEIILPPRFQGTANNYQDDIAGVIVAHAFKFETFVRPVCINFEINIDRIQVQDGTKGKVSTCIKNVPAIFLEYITSDKICAGTLDTKTALCRGDSGGGLAFPIADRGTLRYYLHGVVSTAPNGKEVACDTSGYTAFTHILKHEYFIKRFWYD
ncbi:Fibrillin-2, partial [Operophtera brumata]